MSERELKLLPPPDPPFYAEFMKKLDEDIAAIFNVPYPLLREGALRDARWFGVGLVERYLRSRYG